MGKLTDVQKLNICQRYQTGESAWQISKDYPVASQSIYSLLKRRGICLRSAKDRKLNDTQRAELCRKYEEGQTSYQLAEEYGLVANYVQRLVKSRGIIARGPRKYFYDTEFFDSIDSEDKAYWLGVLYADGWVDKDGLRLGMIDREHIEKFKEALSATYNIEYVENDNQGLYVIRVNDRELVKKLKPLGLVKKKSRIISFPYLPKNMNSHFARGYFDGDGHFSKAKHKNSVQWQVGFTSGSQYFLVDLRCVIRKSIKRDVGSISCGRGEKSNTWSLLFNGNVSCKQVSEFLYKDASVVLDRKHKTYLEMVEVLSVD